MKSKKNQPKAETPQRAPQQWTGAQAALLLAAFVVVSLVIYGPVLNGPFIFDDRYLPFNDPIAANRPLGDWLTFRPLLMFSYWLNYRTSGLEPFLYHAFSVLLHAVNALLVFGIVRRLLGTVGESGSRRDWLSALAGTVFLVHPVQTESVAYVASRSEVLSVFFGFSVLWLYLRERAAGISWRTVALVLVLFAAAVTTKEHTLAIPAVILLTDLFFTGLAGVRRNIRLYGVFAAGAALGGVFIARILATSPVIGFRLQDLTWHQYLATQWKVIWIYLRLYVLPIGLNADYDIAVSNVTDPLALAALAGLIALAVLAFRFRKEYPLAAYGYLVFLLLLAPTSSVIPIRDLAAERRLYLPMLGLLLITVDLLRRVSWQQVRLAGAAVAVVFAGLTMARAAVWASPESLWQDTARKSPGKARPRQQLAHLQYTAGRCQEAADQYASIAKPDYEVLLNLGVALDCAGKPAEALARLEQAAKLEPTAHVHASIAMVHAKQGRNQEALKALEQAEAADSNFAVTYLYRGNVFMQLNNPASAAEQYQRALSLDPANEAARQSLAMAQQQMRSR